MAINLKPVDVAVIGLGAAGGVAVLPLARAGLRVAGIEAGTWMDPRSFKPDEIHNNVRGLVTTVPKAQREIPTFRTSDTAKSRQGATHPMMNAIGGTSIHYHAQSWRLKPWDFKIRSESIRRYGPSSIPKGTTLEDMPVSYDELEPFYDTIEYEVGVSGRAGNIAGRIGPRGNVFEGPRQREYPMPPLRAKARLASVPRARRDQFTAVSRPARVRLPRLLRPRWMSYQRQELDRRHHDPGRSENKKSDHLRSCPCAPH
jgi:gluconate 2-dehydrogenase alpha chain